MSICYIITISAAASLLRWKFGKVQKKRNERQRAWKKQTLKSPRELQRANLQIGNWRRRRGFCERNSLSVCGVRAPLSLRQQYSKCKQGGGAASKVMLFGCRVVNKQYFVRLLRRRRLRAPGFHLFLCCLHLIHYVLVAAAETDAKFYPCTLCERARYTASRTSWWSNRTARAAKAPKSEREADTPSAVAKWLAPSSLF